MATKKVESKDVEKAKWIMRDMAMKIHKWKLLHGEPGLEIWACVYCGTVNFNGKEFWVGGDPGLDKLHPVGRYEPPRECLGKDRALLCFMIHYPQFSKELPKSFIKKLRANVCTYKKEKANG